MVKQEILARGKPPVSKGKILVATVKGDIHDIGKNIVKVILENYGYEVTDLGKDVPPEKIVAEVEKRGIRLVGLSALMTTTLPSMEETIRQLRKARPFCKIFVGGGSAHPRLCKANRRRLLRQGRQAVGGYCKNGSRLRREAAISCAAIEPRHRNKHKKGGRFHSIWNRSLFAHYCRFLPL